MRIKEQEIKEFAGLQSSADDFDVGAVGPVVLTNMMCNRTAIMETRMGYVPVTFESET